MPRHQAAHGNKWDQAFAKQGFVAQTERELEQLRRIGIAGKRIAHLCCNNGVELLSLVNMGAVRSVGFDISELATDEASARAVKFGIEAEYVCSDVFEIDARFHGQFDMVYISAGCLGWMPDLGLFFEIVARLLAPGGTFFAHEMHPFGEMFCEDSSLDGDPLKVIEPYFKDEPYVESGGLDYVGKTQYEAPALHWFVWSLSSIITGLIEAGFRLDHFHESAIDVSANHGRNQRASREAGCEIPLSYILIAGRS